MRMNKYAPFLIAVLIHVLLISIYVFQHKPDEITGSGSRPDSIDLHGFSVASPAKKPAPGKSSTQSAHAKKGSISPESLPAESPLPGPGSGIGPGTGTGTGSESGTGSASGPGIVEKSTEPQYPPLARQKGLEGKVRLRAFYNNDGFITQVDVLDSSGTKMLDESARKALLSWKLKAGHGSASFEKTFQFRLND